MLGESPPPGLLRTPTSPRKRGEVSRTRAPIQFGVINLPRLAPVRVDRAGNAGERAFDEFRHQEAAVVDRSRHARPPLRNSLEADAAVIGLVADQQHEAMPPDRK